MEKYTMFMDQKNQYSENQYTTQSNLQIQCNPYQATNGIFQRTSTNNCQKSRTLSYIYCSTIKEGISHFGLILSTPSLSFSYFSQRGRSVLSLCRCDSCLCWLRQLMILSIFTCVWFSCQVMSDPLRSHGLQPARLLCSGYFPGKNTGVGCHFLLEGIFPHQRSNTGLLHWGFPGGSEGKDSAYNVRDLGSTPGWGRSPEEGNSYPFQYSCL